MGTRATSPTPQIDWPRVPRHDLVLASLYLDVQEGGPGLALAHLDQLAGRDSAILDLRHAYAHEIGRYALQRRGWDLEVYAECTPRFYAGCYHGVMEAYVNQLHPLDIAKLSDLCARIAGSVTPEVAWIECAHGLGHGLWFRLRGKYHDALSYCDRLAGPLAQQECRDGVFMQRASADPAHGHHQMKRPELKSLECSSEPVLYRRACWHYEGRLFVEGDDYHNAFTRCQEAGQYIDICYWGLGKWIAGQVRNKNGTNGQIISLCNQAPRFAACIAGAVETLVDENWMTEPGERLCRDSPTSGKAACYGKLAERASILRSTKIPS